MKEKSVVGDLINFRGLVYSQLTCSPKPIQLLGGNKVMPIILITFVLAVRFVRMKKGP